jgi:tyrosyl-tRNA synthetase
MWRYYELLTDFSPAQIDAMRRESQLGKQNPRHFKMQLAKSIITDFYSTTAANDAEDRFNAYSRDKKTPDNIEERILRAGPWNLPQLLITLGLATSKNEARRLIQQGGVYVDGERSEIVNSITIWKPGMSSSVVVWEDGKSALLKVGKRRFVRVRFQA